MEIRYSTNQITECSFSKCHLIIGEVVRMHVKYFVKSITSLCDIHCNHGNIIITHDQSVSCAYPIIE